MNIKKVKKKVNVVDYKYMMAAIKQRLVRDVARKAFEKD